MYLRRQLDGDVEAERDEAQQRTDEVKCQLLKLKQEMVELKRLLEELRVEKDHMMTEKADMDGQLEGVETDLVTARRHHVHNFSISGNMTVIKLISWNGSWRCLRET